MIYQTEIYNGYVWEVAREKVLFHLLMKLFWLKEITTPDFSNPRLFNYEFFNSELFNHLYRGLKSQLGKLGVQGCNFWT